MARRVLEQEDPTEINLSPMIDCIFILLIFFIVTTVFVEEKGLQVDKPDAAASSAAEESRSLTFEITADNKIYEEGHEIGIGEVTNLVRNISSDPDVPIVIRAHEKSSHGTFVAVWDAARQGGSNTMSFSTTN
jgi:biopolymer transport protein ExbD